MHPLEGRKQTPEHVAKRVAKQLGQKRTAESRAKMAAAKQGTKQKPETKAKRAASLMGRKMSPEAVAKSAAAKRGKPRSPEMRAKLSLAQKRIWERLTEAEKAEYLQIWIDAGQKASLRTTKDSTIERMVEETLKASGVAYEKQFRVGIYTGDFYIPATNTIVEVNGCWIHRCSVCGWNNHGAEEIRAKDVRKLAYLQSKGYTINIIWEHSIEGHKIKKPKEQHNQ